MKPSKYILTAICLLFVASSSTLLTSCGQKKVKIDDEPAQEVSTADTAAAVQAEEMSTAAELPSHLDGTVGESPAWMNLNGDDGSFGYTLNESGAEVNRIVHVIDYNRAGGNLRIECYSTKEAGKYIGLFDGQWDGYSYTGTFTNYKGSTTHFDLHS